RADGDAWRIEPVDACRTGGHPLQQRLQLQQAGLDQVRIERGEGGLEAGDAEGRGLERDLLLVARVRGVIGRNGADRAVAKACDQRLAVLLRSEERRVGEGS